MDSVIVKLYDLPLRVKAFTRANPDGSYTVILNAKICHDEQVAAFNEEMRHISGNDFDCPDRANIIEKIRHLRKGKYHEAGESC